MREPADDVQNFMSAVAEKCKEKRHHPEWANVGLSPISCALFQLDFF